MADHAVLSASGSHRWLNCTPSARLELEFENTGSEAAREGTAAHALCEHKLKRALHMRSRRPVSDYDSDEMEECTDAYVDFVMEQYEAAKQVCKDPVVLIEQRLDFSCYVPDGFGTGDCLIISDDRLHIIDFKYGMGVLVEAENNPQMKLYALGALAVYEGVGGTKKWERIESYGPKFVENIVQATARDILMYAMKTLRCYEIVAHVHDEIIIEADPRMSLDILCEQMGRVPPWAEGLLLRADGYVCEFYKKD